MNPFRGEAPVRVGGETLTLVFDFDALCAVEEAAGKGLSAILGELGGGNAGLRTSRALVYGGLRAHHPEKTLEDAATILMADAAAVSAALGKALTAALPRSDGASAEGKAKPSPTAKQTARPAKANPAAKAAVRGTGSRSSARGAKRG